MTGWVTFRMSGRVLAGSLDEVREVVRATGIEPLTGTRAPVSGLLELRGHPVPVVDLRTAVDPAGQGDVLVLDTVAGPYGLAVDQVLAVLGPDDLLLPESAAGARAPAPEGAAGSGGAAGSVRPAARPAGSAGSADAASSAPGPFDSRTPGTWSPAGDPPRPGGQPGPGAEWVAGLPTYVLGARHDKAGQLVLVVSLTTLASLGTC